MVKSWKSELPFVAAAALLLFVLYVLTMPRTVTLEDSGEFILVAHHAGIAHPPGYPLYVMLGRLFAALPFGEAAFRIHLMSALFGALACGALYLVCLTLIASAASSKQEESPPSSSTSRAGLTARTASFTAAVLYGCSATFWSQSIIAEVYALNGFLYFAVLALALRTDELIGAGDARADSHLYWMTFLFALALTNHYPLMALGAPAVVVVLHDRTPFILKRWKTLIPLFLAGLLPYLYLNVRSHFDPAVTAFGPVKTLDDFLFYFFRKHYASVDADPHAGWGDRLQFALFFFKRLALEFSPASILFIGGGFVLSWTRLSRKTALALLLAFCSSSLLLLLLINRDYDILRAEAYLVYQFVPFGIAALYVGLALDFVGKLIQDRFALNETSLFARVSPAALGLALALAALFWNLENNNRRRDSFGFDYAATVLESLPHNAAVFVNGDADMGPVAVANMLDGTRRDVVVYSQFGFLFENRLFSERHDSLPTAARRVLALLERKKELFFTMPFEPLIRAVRQEAERNAKSVRIENLGLYLRLYVEGDARGLPPSALGRARRFLDEAAAGRRYKRHWFYHQRTILSSVCEALLTSGGDDHAAFRELSECKFLLAVRHARGGRLQTAADLLEGLIAGEDLPRKERYRIGLEYLVARVGALNLLPGLAHEKLPHYQRLVDQLLGPARSWPACDNKIVVGLLQIGGQLPVRLPAAELQAEFERCENIRPLFKKLPAAP